MKRMKTMETWKNGWKQESQQRMTVWRLSCRNQRNLACLANLKLHSLVMRLSAI